MNIGFSESHWQRIVAIFTWIWLIGSLITSAYFAFWLFPKVYAERRLATVQLYFLAKDLSDNSRIYYPNLEVFRRMFHKDLLDKDFLYLSSCDILPLSQRPICDGTDNWKGITPREVNCIDGVTVGQISAIVSKYLKNHPEMWRESADLLVVEALREAFPLKKLSNNKESQII